MVFDQKFYNTETIVLNLPNSDQFHIKFAAFLKIAIEGEQKNALTLAINTVKVFCFSFKFYLVLIE